MRLQNKAAIVTGAASGFGKAIAQLFASEGAKVMVADINGDGAKTVADDIGPVAIAHRVDVADKSAVQTMVDITVREFGRLDVMVNNAGTTHRNQPMLDVDEATFERIFAVNVKSIYLSALAVVPLFRKQGHGNIINIASTAGISPRAGLTWYNGSKGAAITLSKSMAVELASDKIRVNAICPVMGETGMLLDFMGQVDTPEIRARFVATIPWGRMSRPEDIANAALFLAEDSSDMVTGTALEVDGGRCV